MNETKRPLRFFNTTGPCNTMEHYMLPPEDRLVGAQLPRYIRDKLYWVLHAPRQTGKTTFLQSWMRQINAAAPAYLVIFDRRPENKKQPWDERLSWEVENGITVIGC